MIRVVGELAAGVELVAVDDFIDDAAAEVGGLGCAGLAVNGFQVLAFQQVGVLPWLPALWMR